MESRQPYPYAADQPPHYDEALAVPMQRSFDNAQNVYPNSTHFMKPAQVVTPATVVQQTVIQNVLGPESTMATCPSCHNRDLTNTCYEPNSKTHLLALLMCLLGCVCCFCLPYCINSCQTVIHKCSRCNAFIGTYQN